jgi:acetyl-CoA C-acetyltransferase
MTEAYSVDAIRTPVGRKNGGLDSVHPADLGAQVIGALMRRTGIDPAAVDDVIFGCVDTLGPQAGDIARTCWLVAGMPDSVPGVTVDRQCGSSQQAVHFGAQAVMSGTAELIVAGGVQNMNLVPIASAMQGASPLAGSQGWVARYGDQEVSQFRSAEMIAEKWQISREEMEAYALSSHERALAADFSAEILPVAGVDRDECPRQTSLEQMASLKPLRDNGRITAALASQNADGASALLIASAAAVKVHGLRP